MSPSNAKAPKPAPAATVPAPERAPATRVGVVRSDKRDRTRKVAFEYLAKHPKYGKYTRQRTVLHVHDEKNESHVGDIVEVAPCRPVSKSKSWRVVRIVERRGAAAAALESASQVG